MLWYNSDTDMASVHTGAFAVQALVPIKASVPSISNQSACLLTNWLCNVERFHLPILMCLHALRHHMEADFAEALEFRLHWKGNNSS